MTRGVGVHTDQYFPSSLPGFRDLRLIRCPRATSRAPRRSRAGASATVRRSSTCPTFRQKQGAAQLFAERLAEIGLDVELRDIADYVTTSAYLGRLGNPDEPWDLAQVLWTPDFVDASAFINRLLDDQAAGGTDLAGFDEAGYTELMRRAAQLQGAARQRAYSDLELALARDAAPILPIAVMNEATLVSARVDRSASCCVPRSSSRRSA